MRMKKAEVKAAMRDGTHVAVFTGYKGKDRYSQNQMATDGKEAVVKDMDVPRTVHSGARWDIRGHRANDGIVIQYVEGQDHRTVGPADVLGPWDEYVRARDQHQRVRAHQEDRRRERKQAAERLAGTLGGRVRAIRGEGFETRDHEIVLTIEQAEALLASGRCRP